MLNQCTFYGRLTADPEIIQTNDYTKGSFSIAVERDIPSKDGERAVDFISCVVWNHLAQFLSQHFSKGDAIIVSGRLQTSIWQDDSGSTRSRAEVVANSLYFGESSAAKKARAKQSEATDPNELPD